MISDELKFKLKHASELALEAYTTNEPPSIEDPFTDTQVFCRPSGEIVFPGTQSARDWMSNLQFFPAMGVHPGYRNCFRAVRDRLVGFIADKASNGECKKFTVIGHSLGGAIATIAYDVLRVAFSDFAMFELYTFGSPRVYAKWMTPPAGHQGVRVTHGMDAVGWIPGLTLFGHCGRHIHISRNGRVLDNPSVIRVLSMLPEGLLRGLLAPKRVFSIYDHQMTVYNEWIQSWQ